MILLSLVLCCAHTLLGQPVEIPTALPRGRLILLLHEDATLTGESPAQKQIGPITIRAATALHQQPGILILSPAIWHNLLYRKQWYETQIRNTGSLASLFHVAWTAHQKDPSSKTYAHIHTLLKTDPTLLHNFYIWNTNFTPWLCFTHTNASVVILIPRTYLDERRDLLPRPLPRTYQPDEFATGLLLSQCNAQPLPTHTDELAHALNHARHLHKRSTFSIENLAALFIKKTTIHPLLTIHWNIYMSGHGTYNTTSNTWQHLEGRQQSAGTLSNAHICGLLLKDFATWLTLCNTHLSVNTLYYQSCYGGGQNFAEIYTALRSQKKLLAPHTDLQFPLISGGLGDAPTTMIMPRKQKHHTSTELSIDVDIHLPEFFNRLEKPGASWHEILQPLTNTLSLPGDIHAVSNTPQLLLPGHEHPTPIDVTCVPLSGCRQNIIQHMIRAGMYLIGREHPSTPQAQQHGHIIRGKRAILIMPSTITEPLDIHPYQKIERAKNAYTIFKAPALISLIPGNALHHCAVIILHSLGLKDFITHSFLDFNNQKSTKVFLIDSLTLTNDLKQNFGSSSDSLWDSVKSKLTEWFSAPTTILSDARITLQKVIITVAAEKISCSFVLSGSDRKNVAHKTMFSRPNAQMPLPQTLSLHVMAEKEHQQLYKKYLKLCKKQTRQQVAA
jgi:hypothetical protein